MSIIIGAPKGLDDIPLFSKPEIDELVAGMTQVVTSGTPLEVPAGIQLMHLARMAQTVSAYHKLLSRIAEKAGKLDEVDEGDANAIYSVASNLMALAAEAERVVNVEPPKQETIIRAPGSMAGKLITP